MELFQITEKQISDIVIGDRVRQVIGDSTSLMNNIKMVGQLTPILIDENDVLIDGLHRLKAIESLGYDTIEVRVVSGINQDDHTLIELLSNMDRKAFAWHEEIDLKCKLHAYWTAEAKANGISWGYRETSKKLNCSLGGLSTDLAFADALKIFPDLRQQTTKGRAREIYKALGEQATAIQRMDNLSTEEQSRLAALQSGVVPKIKKPTPKERVPAAKNPELEDVKMREEAVDLEPVLAEEEKEKVKDVSVIYVAENYKTFLHKIPENSVGMVELDPPYAIGFNENYGKSSKIQSKATDWTEKELYEFYLDYLPMIYKKMMDASWVLCWTGKEHYIEINKIAESIGFYTQQPGAWTKVGGSTNQPKRNLVSNWEMYLLFRKGNAQFNTSSLPSSINLSSGNAANRIHQWEKPVALYDHFLKACSRPGTIFLSPFAGSGNCLIAAAKTKMMSLGCDKSQKYIPQFYQRLEQQTGISAEVNL